MNGKTAKLIRKQVGFITTAPRTTKVTTQRLVHQNTGEFGADGLPITKLIQNTTLENVGERRAYQQLKKAFNQVKRG